MCELSSSKMNQRTKLTSQIPWDFENPKIGSQFSEFSFSYEIFLKPASTIIFTIIILLPKSAQRIIFIFCKRLFIQDKNN